uniref:Inward rectifier potassium channel C-terminal domain-containing protein n=1 Tax=Megaselia scalaris TaxID=36166 RepID=T1GT57_MEGSC
MTHSEDWSSKDNIVIKKLLEKRESIVIKLPDINDGLRKRIILKNGLCNVVQGNVAQGKKRYVLDIFTAIVDAQWRWTMLFFLCSLFSVYMFFGTIYWVSAIANGDIEYMERISHVDYNPDSENFTMCITSIKNFVSALTYSIETQHTIGYGGKYTTRNVQSPKTRAKTLMFSKNALISHRDGVPCFMFRIGDLRKSHIINAKIKAKIIRKKVSVENEEIPFYQEDLTFGSDDEEERLLFVWPTTIVHKIDSNSPIYEMSAKDMLKTRFEIVVVLEGIMEATGTTIQARTSYTPYEILWGHRFQEVVSFNRITGDYDVDYSGFDETVEVDTPLCSARKLEEIGMIFKDGSDFGDED